MHAMLEGASQRGGNGIATAIGLVTFFLGSTGAFLELQTALNAIWRVKPKPDAGIKDMLLQRLLSFGLVVGVGFVLLVSLLVSAALSALNSYIGQLVPQIAEIWQGVNTLVSLGVVTLLFAMIYQFLPDVDLRLGRRLGRGTGDGRAVQHRQVPDRALSRHQRCGVGVRRGGVGGGAAGVGVLLGADRAAGRGVHQGVRGALRRTTSQRCHPMRRRIRTPEATGGKTAEGEAGGEGVRRCHPEERMRRGIFSPGVRQKIPRFARDDRMSSALPPTDASSPSASPPAAARTSPGWRAASVGRSPPGSSPGARG